MASLVMLRVILAQPDIWKRTLPSGIQLTVGGLLAVVKEAFDIQEEFTLQYIDIDFGDHFFTVTSTDLIEDKSILKSHSHGSLLISQSINTKETLAENLYQQTVYPPGARLCAVAEGLLKQFWCLKELGSVSGCYGWLSSLKYQMGNYKTKLRSLGCPEVTVNSVKLKKPQDATSCQKCKKAKKGRT